VTKTVFVWFLSLIVALAVLSGRYDWSAQVAQYSLRGYLSSAYLLVVLIPTAYYTVRKLVPGQSKLALAAAMAIGIVCTLPYQWLGLSAWYYFRDRPTWWHLDMPGVATPEFDWLPGALQRLRSMPHEVLFFLSLGALGLGLALICRRLVCAGEDARRVCQWRYLVLVIGLFWLILLQTWLHLSVRSPYTYYLPFARPEWAARYDYWFAVYLFPDRQAAVNADYHLFRALEEHFTGNPGDRNLMMLRRALPFYISSQFSYFVSPYYVFLVLNVVLWGLAAWSVYRFVSVLWHQRVAVYAAVLVASGSGFIYFVAQPMSYLAGYASIAIIIYVFESLLPKGPQQRIGIGAQPGTEMGRAARTSIPPKPVLLGTGHRVPVHQPFPSPSGRTSTRVDHGGTIRYADCAGDSHCVGGTVVGCSHHGFSPGGGAVLATRARGNHTGRDYFGRNWLAGNRLVVRRSSILRA
jgi:hypothetical protein